MKSQINAKDLLQKVSVQDQQAELYEVHSFQLPVRFSAGSLDSVRVVEEAGRALRVIQDGRLGFSTTTDMTDAETVAQNALQAAQFGDPVAFQFSSESDLATVDCFDPEIEQLAVGQLVDFGEAIVARFQNYNAEIQVDVEISKTSEQVRLLNTSGLQLEERRTNLVLQVSATRPREGDILMVYDAVASRRKQDIDAIALVDKLIERLRWAENIVKVQSGAMPVVFRSTAALALFVSLMHALNGRHVYQDTSRLSAKLGEQVFDPRFSIVDNGRLTAAPFAASFDDEGAPTTEKALVEGGVVRQFFYDIKTAALVGVQPTGNGFKSNGSLQRGFRYPQTAAASAWLTPPGEQSLEQILSGLDEALLVESILGLGQGNVSAGEFSNNVALGFLVRKGEIVGRVKNTMIAGNAFDLLKDRLIGLSDQPEWISGILHSPAIVIDGVGVASKG